MGYCEGRSLELEFSSLKRLFVLYKELQVGFEPLVTAPLLHARVWLRYNIQFFGIIGILYENVSRGRTEYKECKEDKLSCHWL